MDILLYREGLKEFEKEYSKHRDPSMTEEICLRIAEKHGWDVEEFTDYVYINRYEDEEDMELPKFITP